MGLHKAFQALIAEPNRRGHASRRFASAQTSRYEETAMMSGRFKPWR